MRIALLPLITLLGLAVSGSAAIKTTYVDLESFTDFSISGGNVKHARAIFEGELARDTRLQNIVGEDRVLELTITDIDMAGDIQPWRNRNYSDIRYVQGAYPPRMSFSYVLRDANGNEIASGEEHIRNLSFDFDLHTTGRHRSFHYELNMLEDWARKTLPRVNR